MGCEERLESLLVIGGLSGFAECYVKLRSLTGKGIPDRYAGAVLYQRVLYDDALDLFRRDLDAAVVDHVVFPAEHVYVAVFVDVAQVFCVNVAVLHSLGGELRFPEILFHVYRAGACEESRVLR